MVRSRVVILTAVALEARAIARVWGLKTPKPGQQIRTSDRDPIIEIHLIGIRARPPTNLTDPPVAAIILAGLAGGLDPSLKIGDLIIDDCPANDWLPSTPHRVGKIACSPTMLSTPADKQKLYAQTGALAVDMESPARAGGQPEHSLPAHPSHLRHRRRHPRPGHFGTGRFVRPCETIGDCGDAGSPAGFDSATKATRQERQRRSREPGGGGQGGCSVDDERRQSDATPNLRQGMNCRHLADLLFVTFAGEMKPGRS